MSIPSTIPPPMLHDEHENVDEASTGVHIISDPQKNSVLFDREFLHRYGQEIADLYYMIHVEAKQRKLTAFAGWPYVHDEALQAMAKKLPQWHDFNRNNEIYKRKIPTYINLCFRNYNRRPDVKYRGKEDLSKFPEKDSDPEKYAMILDDARLTQSILKQMKPRLAEALELRYIDEFTINQLSKTLGLTEKKARTLVEDAEIEFRKRRDEHRAVNSRAQFEKQLHGFHEKRQPKKQEPK